MSESPFSPLWYRCVDLKPQLRSHARLHRHDYRDELWYVLEDPSSGRFHRFTPAAYHVIGLMDGTLSVEEIWRHAVRTLGEDAPTQGEMIHLLGQLHNADVLQSDVPPDVRELFSRHQRMQRVKWKQRLANPLAVRIPLLDPERFLARTLPLVRPIFGGLGVTVWIVVVALALGALSTHWSALTEDVVDRALSVQNLLILWAVYPFVKLLHELGHAFATKVWGGEVHEIGIMLLVLFPVPYVEASSASAFRSKRQRMLVGAAGILVEMFLAAVALLVWVNVETGAVSAIAYNVMLIGGVSTVLFNGNPLLRFDGYYVLADFIEMPNLATRSKQYLSYLTKRYLFNLQDIKSPAASSGERRWLFFYGVASFVYRMFIMFFIALFIASKYFVIGVVLAFWALLMTIVVPLAKALAFLFTSPQLSRNRPRATLVSGLLIAGLAAVLFALPIPLWTRSEGVVWVPDQAHVRAAADGLVVELLANEGDEVAPGQALVETKDPLILSHVRILQARLDELQAQLTAYEFADRTRAHVIRQEIVSAKADLGRARERVAALILRAPVHGVFVLPNASDLPGRFVRRGELIGYVRDPSVTTVRVVVDQDAIGLVRERTQSVQVRMAQWGSKPVPAVIQRAVPAATNRLPTRALGSTGGGRLLVDPRDGAGLRTLQRVFEMDLTLPRDVKAAQLGGRAFVRFDHGEASPASQLYRALRQLFLSRFNV